MKNLTRRECLGKSAAVLAGAGLGRLPLLPVQEQKDLSDRAPSSPVAIQRCDSYKPPAFRRALDKVLDLIGGLKPLVQDKTVTIKLNLTGTSWKPVFDLPAQETYQTQPDTVAALCAALVDAGAKRIVLIENLYWTKPFEEILVEAGWDVKAIQSAGDHRVTFEDTRNRGAFPGYSRFKVPWGGFIYPSFDLNSRFEKTDVLVSLAKLKQHACAGITAAVKNFFGNTPSSIYGDDGPGEHALKHRAAMFHGGKKKPPEGVPGEIDHGQPAKPFVRVPRITADIYGARPADLCIVDGIRTIRGGEGHWNRGIGLIEPRVLIAGRNGVCTDAVGTAVMGFDPRAASGQPPFQGDNHLSLLASVGVGTNDLRRIEVAGVPVEEARCPFAAPQEK